MTLLKHKSNILRSPQSGLFLFSDGALMIVAALVSLFLQIISFVTTLDGAKAYFAETFKYAPLLFALSVQSVVYFLENTVKFRAGAARITALVLAIICSNYFSYVGIYNNINSPAQYLEEAYSSYEKQLTAEYTAMLSDSGTSSSDVLNNAVNTVSARYGELSSRVALLERAEKELDGVTDENTAAMTAPNRWAYENYEDYAAAYSAYITSLSSGSSAEKTSRTQTILAQYGFESREQLSSELSALSAEMTMISTAVEVSAENLGITAGEFSTLLEALRIRLAADVDDGLSAESRAAVSQLITVSNGIKGSISAEDIFRAAELNALSVQTFIKPFNELSEGLSDSPVTLRTVLMRELNSAADRFNAAAELCGNEARYSSENFTLYDIYVLPIMCLMSPTKAPMAFLCLAIAVSVDLLSLIFAFISTKKKPSLALKSTSQAIATDSHIFERNIASALALSLQSEYGEADDERLMSRLAEFIGHFTPTVAGHEQGFSLCAPQSELSHYSALLAFLSQFGMAKLMSSELYNELSKASQGVPAGEDIGGVVLLKMRFLLWYSEQAEAAEPPRAITKTEVTA